jgi:hypothetical protein
VLLSADVANGADAYVLKGRIIRADSKNPVPGVSVRLLESGNRAVTDAEGQFALEHVNSGRYTFVISHPQYIEQRFVLQIPPAPDLEIEVRPPPLYHETVIVTAAPWAVDRADVAQSANVLDTAEVRVRSGLSVGDAISSLPGVRSISTGEAGGVPMIRGQTNERVRVLSNGFPHDYYQFSRRHMPNIETYDSSSIEVIRGPASVLYGTQAMGGLTNLVSAPLPAAHAGSIRSTRKALWVCQAITKQDRQCKSRSKRRLRGRASWTRRAADNIGTPEGGLPNTDYDQQASLLKWIPVHEALLQRANTRYWANELGFTSPSTGLSPDLRNDLANLKPPGLQWGVAFSRIFPETPGGIHAGDQRSRS